MNATYRKMKYKPREGKKDICLERKMDKKPSVSNSKDVEVLRKGPWTVEEDLILISHVANHGEGLWSSLAKSAGLKRTGKSCRLRWLNYLRPDVRRGNITPKEQLLIIELQAKWGNRWSKIAKNLPGRTDNEIKNFWRTRIQKHIKEAESSNTCSSNSYKKKKNENSNSNNYLCESQSSETTASHPLISTADTAPAQPYSPVIIPPFEPPHRSSHVAPPLPSIAGEDHNDDHHILQYSGDSSYSWSLEDLWSMQLLNGDYDK